MKFREVQDASNLLIQDAKTGEMSLHSLPFLGPLLRALDTTGRWQEMGAERSESGFCEQKYLSPALSHYLRCSREVLPSQELEIYTSY